MHGIGSRDRFYHSKNEIYINKHNCNNVGAVSLYKMYIQKCTIYTMPNDNIALHPNRIHLSKNVIGHNHNKVKTNMDMNKIYILDINSYQIVKITSSSFFAAIFSLEIYFLHDRFY